MTTVAMSNRENTMSAPAFLIFLMISSGESYPFGGVCVSRCSCIAYATKLKVDCGHRGISAVPSDIPRKTTTLDLSYNTITVLTRYDFDSLFHLENVDLSYNKIQVIDTGTLDKLKNLSYLNFENNNLSICDNASLPTDLFKNQNHLRILNLKRNLFCEKYPDQTFRYLKGIESFHINAVPNLKLGYSFGLMHRLKLLDLSGKEDEDLKKDDVRITNDSFTAVGNTTIKTMVFQHASLREIEINAFAPLKNIETLDLSYNDNLETHKALETAYGLKNSYINRFLLNRTHSGGILRLENHFLRYLNQTSIKHLSLDYNSIYTLEDGYHHNFAKLESLSLGDNLFSTGHFIRELGHLKNLKLLNVSWRNRDRLDEKRLSNSYILTEVGNVSNAYKSQTGVSRNGSIHSEPVLFFFCPPRLEYLYASHLKVVGPIPHIVSSKNRVRYLDFSNNGFCPWEGPIQNINRSIHLSVLHLDLSNNGCNQISENFFDSFPELTYLKIGGNKLRKIITSKRSLLFSLQKLELLDISSSFLTMLPDTFLKRQSKLRCLDVHDNAIVDINFSLEHMARLDEIDLSNNNIMVLQKNTCNELTALSYLTNISIDLTNNTISCSCNTLHFIKWLRHTRVKLKNFTSYTCKMQNGQTRYIHALDLDALERRCFSKGPMVFDIILLGSGILLITGISFLFRYRYGIELFCLKLRLKRRGYLECLDIDKNKYDAFVSYSEGDRAWIWDNFTPRLEIDRKMTLCIYERDFVPGKLLTDNIIRSIFSSRKIVLVLSRNFLESSWCRYESQLAQIRRIEERTDIIVIIKLTPLPVDLLSNDLIALMNTVVYLEWPLDEADREEFYRRLEIALY